MLRSNRTLRTACAVALMLTACATTRVAAEEGLPVVTEHRYRMLAKVRPLLFWISRDDVGGAKVSWRRNDAEGFGLDLLIGSDPQKAPRKINKWGYIAEEVRGSQARVVGVMKQSNEQSIADAEKAIGAEGRQGFVYRAIQGTADAREARAGVTKVSVERDLTYRDIDALLAMLGADGGDVNKTVALPPGTRPGFLVALHDLVTGKAASSVPFVYFGGFYDLSAKNVTRLGTATIDGKRYTNVARSDFEVRSRANGDTTRFQLTYGTEGALAGVPIHAVYQPRWWFEVQLFLDERAAF